MVAVITKLGDINMTFYRSDILIKELRMQQGLTQVQLCEGICTKGTLSRIERGLYRPDWYTFERLMQRLGEDPYKYYTDIITVEDQRRIEMKDKINNLLKEKKSETDQEVEGLISVLEQEKNFKNGINLQFLLYAKARLAFHRKDFISTYDLATAALRITKPYFSEDNPLTYILSIDEINLINLIAVVHFSNNSVEKAAELLLRIKESMDLNLLNDEKRIKAYLQILYNITKYYGLLKRYEECLPLCDRGVELCTTYRNSFFHPLFIFHKACCLLYLQDIENGADLAGKTYSIFMGLDRYAEALQVVDYLKSEFNITLPFA